MKSVSVSEVRNDDRSPFQILASGCGG